MNSSQANQKHLILFFNGWGMDDNPIKHLDLGEYSLYTVNNYQKEYSEDDFKFLKNYPHKTLVAWSFGVFMAATLLKEHSFTESIAINGTLLPVDQQFGLSPQIATATLNNLSPDNLLGFYQRITMDQETRELFLQNQPQREFEEIKAELKFLINYSSKKQPENIFSKVIIGQNDRIFSPRNQNNYWQDRATIKKLDIPHYPFYGYQSWKEVINAATDQ